MEEEFKELKEKLEIIETTAKLLGYRTEIFSGNPMYTHLYGDDRSLHISVESIKQKHENTLFIVRSDYTSELLNNVSRELKLASLQKVLEEL